MESIRYLTDDERIRLLARAEPRAYAPNELILAEGVSNEDIYILIGGSARVEMRTPHGSVTIGRIDVGEAFGEMSLLDGCPTLSSVVANTATEAYVLPLASVADLLEEDPVLASHLYHSLAVMLARRLRDRTIREVLAERRAE
jgi:CRP-like cAMP-binding protein